MEFLSVAAIGLVIAVVSAILLWSWGKRYIPAVVADSIRRSFLSGCLTAPFLGLLWIVLVFVGYTYLNDWLFHRDNWMSTNPHTPLPNGYVLGSVDYQSGYIVSPGRPVSDHPRQYGNDRLADLLDLQVTKDYILGKQWMWDEPTHTGYFIWDLRSNDQLHFGSLAELQAAAAQRGIWVATVPDESWVAPNMRPADVGQALRVDLVSYWDLYEKYRYTWFDLFAILLMIGGQVAILIILVRWGMAIRASFAEVIR